MATGYDPSTYNPNAPSPTANGTTGSMTSGSIGNAVIQSSPPSGNPYADAIQHTANWMQYVSPTSKLGLGQPTGSGTTPPIYQTNGAPAPLLNGLPSGVMPVGTGATIGNTAMSNARIDQGATPPNEQPPIGQPVNPPPAAPPTAGTPNPNGGTSMAPPPNSGAGPSTANTPAPKYNLNDWAQQLGAAGVKNTQEMVDLANRYSQSPGFEWVSPMTVAQYRAAVAGGGENTNMSFAEWAVRNHKAETMTPNNPALTAGMNDWAQRLRNEMAQANPHADTTWVNGNKVLQYQMWNDQNGGVDPKTGRALNFWEWAGTIGNGKGVYSPGSNPDGPQPPPETPPPGAPGVPPPGGGGAGGGGYSSNSGPQGGYSPDGQTYLDNLFGALRNQYSQYNEQQMREFRHQAGLGGMQNSGAYGVNLGNTYRQLLGDENAKLADVMAGQTDAERQRLAQIALANISAATGRYAADQGLAGAQAGANASMFGSQLDYNKGIYGIDATREGNAMQNNLDWQRLMLQYLQQIYGTSPGAILGGQQPPTGTIIVH